MTADYTTQDRRNGRSYAGDGTASATSAPYVAGWRLRTTWVPGARCLRWLMARFTSAATASSRPSSATAMTAPVGSAIIAAPVAVGAPAQATKTRFSSARARVKIAIGAGGSSV